MDVVLLFPGQGAQHPGMGSDLAAAFPEARSAFAEADRALGFPLSALCFEGPEDRLRATENAQPALLAHSAAVWAVIGDRVTPHVRAAAGHSLGEFSAYHAAGALSLGDAAVLVRRRGELMQEAGVRRPGAMAAILGDLEEPVDALCERASRDAGDVVPANYNSAAQTVVSGEVAGVDRVMELARAVGGRRSMRLNVSGAFHSPLMAPAEPGLRAALGGAALADPRFPVYSNVTAEPVFHAAAACPLLLRQLTSPVRWLGIMQNLGAAHPQALFVEVGAGHVLSGLAKRTVAGARTLQCGTAAEVEHLLSLIDRC